MVALIVFMDFTFEEAAAKLGYSEKQVRRNFPRILDRLTRECFAREFFNLEMLTGNQKKPMGRARPGTIEANAVV